MKQIHFYMCGNDLRPALEWIEQQHVLRYSETGNNTSPEFAEFRRASEIPDFGLADTDTGSTCRSYLVTSGDTPVSVEVLQARDGRKRYCIDQLMNPDSVVMTPAGLRGASVVLAGRVDTVSNSAISKQLMLLFPSAMTRHYVKIQEYRVGPRAREILDSGGRLTIALQSPPEFNLVNTNIR